MDNLRYHSHIEPSTEAGRPISACEMSKEIGNAKDTERFRESLRRRRARCH
ncbi:hypothetical protein SNOG_08766 [Parastagonospora nodorum SN15]|uniref:Uncharacterized protein n=1 Tax=Phaeosphaeria nodorum (strain SN15 / ATCC MYA-4574 / FGSC 10173) TaxID=321614 RepID=Q0UHJ8_PHANO|nr:hypothetical protein SNOG_08766 [Parastagonospora nodorum SN15]EAT83934.1 hypothetical protein SNOG_08766 [Parastagonospora nodorum SN15]